VQTVEQACGTDKIERDIYVGDTVGMEAKNVVTMLLKKVP